MMLDSGKKKRRGRHIVLPGCILILLILLLLILIAVLVAAFLTNGFGLWQERHCQTAECTKAAARIVQYMDPKAEPCDDFYQFACGNFDKVHTIPPGQTRTSNFNVLQETLYSRLIRLYSVGIKANENKAFKQAKNFYKSCLDIKTIETAGLKPIQDYLKEIGGWPVLTKTYDDKTFNFEDLLVKLSYQFKWPTYAGNVLSVGVTGDPENSNKHIVQVNQGDLGAGSKSYYLEGTDNKIVVAYAKLIEDVAVALGADAALAKTEVIKVILLEKKLAKILLSNEDNRESSGNDKIMTVEEMSKQFKGINWETLVKKTFDKVGKATDNTTRVHVWAVPYFQKLGEVLGAENKRTLATYMVWNVIRDKLGLLNEKIRSIKLDYDKVKTGKTSESPRSRTCASITNNAFKMVTVRLYVDEYFNTSLDNLKEMSEGVMKAFQERLEESKWLSDDSKRHAKEKAEKLRTQLAYPDYIHDDAKLEQRIDKLTTMNPGLYFANAIDIDRKNALKKYSKLDQPKDRFQWWMAPVTVNAYYDQEDNKMVFPVGILAPPFYDYHGLQANNYGAIGEVFGHEITHGFDSDGRLYDKDGNRKKWMSAESVKNFEEEAQCIVDFYSNITAKQVGINVNGKRTQRENIADSGALSQAYKAYNNWVDANGSEDKLPGLNLSVKKTFFLSYAQMECSIFTDEALKTQLEEGNHTPGRERILANLMNDEEFSKAYNCPIGSKMNPEKKCKKLW